MQMAFDFRVFDCLVILFSHSEHCSTPILAPDCSSRGCAKQGFSGPACRSPGRVAATRLTALRRARPGIHWIVGGKSDTTKVVVAGSVPAGCRAKLAAPSDTYGGVPWSVREMRATGGCCVVVKRGRARILRAFPGFRFKVVSSDFVWNLDKWCVPHVGRSASKVHK
jgi:hypothetical protein